MCACSSLRDAGGLALKAAADCTYLKIVFGTLAILDLSTSRNIMFQPPAVGSAKRIKRCNSLHLCAAAVCMHARTRAESSALHNRPSAGSAILPCMHA
jgi:hypothetical protein